MSRNRHPSGRLESPKSYAVRKYCSLACFAEAFYGTQPHPRPSRVNPEPVATPKTAGESLPDRLPSDIDPRCKTGGRMSYKTKVALGIIK